MPLNTAKILEKWKRNAGASSEAFKDGVNNVKQSPTAKAAQAVDKYRANVLRAIDDGSYVDGLNKVTLSDWQQATAEKGSRNYQNGVSSISPRAAKAMADQQQYAEQVSLEISNMPSLTESDMEARMLANVRKMKEYRKR